MRRQLELSNEVAAALSGSNDQILRALEGHVDCELFLRGNVITLDGEAEAVAAAAVVVRELSDLIEQGHEIAEGTIAAVTDALDQHESPAEVLEDVVWRHRSTRVAPKTVNQKRYVDSIRRNTITFGIGPAGTGKTFLAVAMAAAALSRREVNRIILTRPAVEAGERLGFLPGDLMAKIDPVPAAAVRRAARHDRPREGRHPPRAQRDRGGAAGLHARAHAQRLVRDPRRGAEHEPRADEDVPHAPGLQLEDGHHRRHHPDRPPARPALGPRGGRARSSPRWRASSSCASAAPTSCATASSSASSRPTTSTPSAPRPSCARPQQPDRRRA